MKKSYTSYMYTFFGSLLLLVGLYLIKNINESHGIMAVLPYWLVGFGCGIFGHGVGDIIKKRVVRKQPELVKKLEIEQKDERNIAIGNHAKAKAYDIMIFVFGALMFCFSIMGVDMSAILLFVLAYLFIVGYNVFYRLKFEKDM